MRVSGGFGLALLLSASAFAQGHGFFNPQPTFRGGFGNVVFPGGTPATYSGVQRSFPNIAFPGGGGPRLNVPFSNQNPTAVLPSFGVANLGPSVGQRRSRRVADSAVGFYAVPVYGGYGAGYGAGYSDNPYPADAAYGAPAAQQPPNVIVVYPQAPQAAYAPQPPPQVYQEEPAAAAAEAPHFLIAFKDHTIYSAIAYWVQGDTLHYFTSGNTHNQVSLSLVDRDLTERLNRESGTDMRLPR